jgi:hypothetical protein
VLALRTKAFIALLSLLYYFADLSLQCDEGSLRLQ